MKLKIPFLQAGYSFHPHTETNVTRHEGTSTSVRQCHHNTSYIQIQLETYTIYHSLHKARIILVESRNLKLAKILKLFNGLPSKISEVPNFELIVSKLLPSFH
uniref:Putative ovule protein n=1 Tax=Solanum chacoense TaxID=4108 RepID=A0A0V0H5S0_SOLCH